MKKICKLFAVCMSGIFGFSQSMKEFLAAREATFPAVGFSVVQWIGNGFEEPSGFGLRNFRSRLVYRICGKIDEEIYTIWKPHSENA